MNIIKGQIPGAKKVVIYGPEGIGKSTFVSKFPDVVYIDTEGSTKAMDVARFDAPQKWEDILDAVDYVLADKTVCRTLAIDTADWAEMLCIKYTCDKGGVKGIEDFGYGKGYVYVAENFKVLLDRLEKVIAAGINVVITAHAKMRKFEQPDEMGAYDRWEMKLTKQVAPMLKEWADMVLFANYKTYVVEDDKTKSKKAQGGKRVMYATHNPCWDAKNRYGLEDCIPFDYAEIKKIIEPDAKATPAPKKAEKKSEPKQEPKPEPKAKTETPKQEPKTEAPKDEPEHMKKLRELMARDDISEDRLIAACASKGICFTGEKLTVLSEDFIKNSLIAKWAGFAKYAKKIDITQDYIPFDAGNKKEGKK